MVLENGIREIVGEVRNSLDFHRSQEGGGEVRSVVLSGPALEMRGFSEVLEADLGLEVRRESVHFADERGSGRRAPDLPPSPGDRHRSCHRGGAPMRAVNLIPTEQRKGGAVGRRSQGAAFAVLGLLAGAAILTFMYGMADHQVESRKAEAAELTARAAHGAERGGAADPVHELHADARTAPADDRAADQHPLRLVERDGRTEPRAARGRLAQLAGGDGRRVGHRQHELLGGGQTRRRLLLSLFLLWLVIRHSRERYAHGGSGHLRRSHLGDPRGRDPDLHARRLRREPDRRCADTGALAPGQRRQQRDPAELNRVELWRRRFERRGLARRRLPRSPWSVAFQPLPAPPSTSTETLEATADPSSSAGATHKHVVSSVTKGASR